MIYNFCTVCDSGYLLKGMALYESLVLQFEDKFILHWLCIDDGIFDVLTKLGLEHVNSVKLSEIEKKDKELCDAKNNPASEYGDQYSQYCWSLTPYFINYCLYHFVKEDELLIYVDSDIYFFHSPKQIIEAVGEKSIGIHTHRFGGDYREDINTGWYNVGVVVFRKDRIGWDISSRWKHWLLKTDHEYYKSHGTTGDQKYLELFAKIAGKEHVCVFDVEFPIGHLAAWNSDNLKHPEFGYIEIYGGIQPMVFFHYSHFTYDFIEDKWSDSYHGEWNPAKDPHVKVYFEKYYEAIKRAYFITKN
jgi:hypothetical protein